MNATTSRSLLAAVIAAAVHAPLVGAKPPPAPIQVELECREQPTRQVQFDGAGQVNYAEIPASIKGPINLTIVKAVTGEDYLVEPATIESSEPWLERDQAVWSRENQIEADNGLLRIDLKTLKMFLTESDAQGNARFRRFDCERVAHTPSAE